MNTTTYPGLDYSGPGATCNRNLETGIRYGVISQRSICPDALDDIYHGQHSTDRAYISWLAELRKAIKHAASDYVRDVDDFVEHAMDWDWLGENYQGDEIQPEFNDGDYLITKCLDSDLFIGRSPFFTYAQYCSPCVPGAGNLDSPCPDGPKTYCLGHDWFEDGTAPYPVYSVATGQQVEPKKGNP